MNLASDNTGPVHPRVMDALLRANAGRHPSYGADPFTAEAVARIRDAFEAPEAAVLLVPTGTAANALALATLARPWDAIFCAEQSHAHEDECGAPEFYAGGAKLVAIPTPDARLTPALLHDALARWGGSVHSPQRGPVTVTSVSERGTLLGPAEIRALADTAHGFGSRLHLDGARLANALAALGCSPADLTWRAGVDALSLGGTKNGLMGAEAVVLFDPALGWELELRRKRAGQLLSKHRFLGAQMAAYLEDGLWLDMARAANAAMARLLAGLRPLGAIPTPEPGANLAFLTLPRRVHRRLRAAGVAYYLFADAPDAGDPDEPLPCRMVCDWSATDAEIDHVIAAAAAP